MKKINKTTNISINPKEVLPPDKYIVIRNKLKKNVRKKMFSFISSLK